jgi:hypothetical protein
MVIRREVEELVKLGPFPDSEASEEEDLQRREDLLALIEPPLTREEAMAMLRCFGPDEAFGLAWSVLHLVESAPGGAPISAEPHESENEWIRRLWDRRVRALQES